ncbi:unnamed protein product [Lactuca saligna]|uniref:RING-type E3 ubiquitin transferase n=1 Tax=Lactuca saligna TaxID=75948 RepID=A0AA35Y615_LACSI|nr:unnamed protein product [Lactuca saligna]
MKWVVVVLVFVALTSSAAAETSSKPPPALSPPQRVGSKINTPMVIVPTCLLIAFLLIFLFFFYFGCHYVEHQLTLASTIINGGGMRSMKLAAACGLDPAVIATFTTFTYSTVKEMKIGQHVLECAVCLIEFTDHEALRLLPECNHVFHRTCIDEWLALHVTCPVCRASLVPKPNQLSHAELCCGPNGPTTNGHVSIKVFDLKHNLSPVRKFPRSYSTGHLMMERPIEDVERYTLRLSEEAQHVLKNLVANPLMSPNVSNIKESSLKKSLKSASANFVRGSDYFDYERFGQVRQQSERNLAITRSLNTRGGSNDVEGELMTSSQRFIMFVKSPLNRLSQISNKNTIDKSERLTLRPI